MFAVSEQLCANGRVCVETYQVLLFGTDRNNLPRFCYYIFLCNAIYSAFFLVYIGVNLFPRNINLTFHKSVRNMT